MLSFIRRQLSSTNLLVLAALIFAMAGGAFAATGGGKHHGHAAGHHGHASKKGKGKKGKATGKRGPRGKQGPAGPEGKEGPQGPAGPAGTSGAKGDTGLTGATGPEGPEGPMGSTGPEGQPGESVTVTSLAAGEGGCVEGGAEFSDKSGSASACNGKSAGGTLEAEKVEMGMWSMQLDPLRGGKLPEKSYDFYESEAVISFPEPLPAEDQAKVEIYYVPSGVGSTEQCPGVTANESVPGTLCVYGQQESENLGNEPFHFNYSEPEPNAGYYLSSIVEGLKQNGSFSGSYEIGAKIIFAQLTEESESPGAYASGAWILTAPERT